MTTQKKKFSIKDFFSKCDLVTFTEKIVNGKIHFLCSVCIDILLEPVKVDIKRTQTKKLNFPIYEC